MLTGLCCRAVVTKFYKGFRCCVYCKVSQLDLRRVRRLFHRCFARLWKCGTLLNYCMLLPRLLSSSGAPLTRFGAYILVPLGHSSACLVCVVIWLPFFLFVLVIFAAADFSCDSLEQFAWLSSARGPENIIPSHCGSAQARPGLCIHDAQSEPVSRPHSTAHGGHARTSGTAHNSAGASAQPRHNTQDSQARQMGRLWRQRFGSLQLLRQTRKTLV